MDSAVALEKCRSFVSSLLKGKNKPEQMQRFLRQGPAVTISRQTGSGSSVVAEKLADYLQAQAPGPHCAWTVFDRNLVEQVLEEHNLPRKLAQFMPEEHLSFIQDAMEELVGLHPSTWTLVHQTAETILHLAQVGHVILVGRGASRITAKTPNAFHVRLVGSLERRVAHVAKLYRYDLEKALQFVRKTDRGRRRYLRENFSFDADDPLSYHLVINTDRIAYEEAARIIGEAALRHFQAYARTLAQSRRSEPAKDSGEVRTGRGSGDRPPLEKAA